MPTFMSINPVIAAKDIERARRWYAEKLGLNPVRQEQQGLFYEVGSTSFFLYPTSFAGTAQNTVAGWVVADLDAAMADMRGRGVVFEEYDFPGLKTVNGVATLGDFRSAWFKDSEGNTFSIGEEM